MSQPYSQAAGPSWFEGTGSADVTAAVDEALDQLMAELPELAEQAMSDPEIEVVLSRLKLDEADVRARLVADAPGRSGITSPEIGRVQQAMRAIAVAGGSREVRRASETEPPAVVGAYLAILVAWTVMVAAIVAVVGVWSGWVPLPGPAWVWSILIWLLSAALVATACAVVVERCLGVIRLGFVDARGALAGQVVLIEAYAAGLVLLWPESVNALGQFWAVFVWALAAFLVFVVNLVVGALYYFEDYDYGLLGYVLIGSAGSLAVLTAVALGWPSLGFWIASDTPYPAVAYLVLGGMLIGTLSGLGRLTARQNHARAAAVAELTAHTSVIRWSAPRVATGWARTTPTGSELLNRTPLAERQRLEHELKEAEQAWRTATVQRAMLPALRNFLNQLVAPGHSVQLRVHDAPGLKQMRSTEYIVETRVFDRFRRAVEGIRGGAIGIAGPRGAGKTTLLEAVATGRLLPVGEIPPLVVMEAVPVKYEAREFLLHLYAQVCTALLSPEDLQERRPRSRWKLPFHVWLRPAVFLTVLGVVAFVGHRVLHDDVGLEKQITDAWWPMIAVIGITGLLVSVARATPSLRGGPLDRPGVADSFDDLVRSADRRLREVRFQQRFTTGWSGKITTTVGAELSGSRTTDLTANVRSYPEIVFDFRALLMEVLDVYEAADPGGVRHVVVIIDELDKISSAAEAERFINEIKSIFTLDRNGYLYLVSVSEEALASFEQEGLAARDAFNSAFDDIQRIEYLTLLDTTELLRSRVIGLADPFVCLCHCLSGGLPREIVRVARDVVEGGSATESTLSGIAARLIGQDVRDRLNGLDAAVRNLEGCEPWTSDFLVAVRSSLGRPVTAAGLLAVAERPPLSAASWDGTPPTEVAGLFRIQLATLTYLYFAATILEVFHDGLTLAETTRGREDGGGDGTFDRLASVRAQIASRPRRAWLTVSSFRGAWNLRVLDPPPVGPPVAAPPVPVRS